LYFTETRLFQVYRGQLLVIPLNRGNGLMSAAQNSDQLKRI